MELMVSHIVLSIFVGGACLAVGWWLRSHAFELTHQQGRRISDESMIRELLSSVHALSLRAAADVGEHNSTVDQVGRELHASRARCSGEVSQLVDRLLAANQSVQDKLAETEGKLDQLSAKLEHAASEARTDVLTGLANRRAFQEEIVRLGNSCQQVVKTFSVIMIDIDRFKQVNDVHGHAFGDEVLRGLGAMLRDSFRGRDLVTRYGGEEFVVLMPATGVAEARRVAEEVRETIERTRFEYSGKSLQLTVSLGVAEIMNGEATPELLKRTDQAMYAAKHAGRNRVYWHDGILSHPLRAAQHRNGEEACSSILAAGRIGSDTALAGPSVRVAPPSVPLPGHEADADEEPGPDGAERADQPDRETLNQQEVDVEALQNMGTKTMFCQSIHRRIAEFKRGGTPFAALLLQVDDEEDLASTYGDQALTLVMGVVARAIRARLREMDLVARYNDATFGMVLPNATLRNAICVGERLRKQIMATSVQLGGRTIRFTISLGAVDVNDEDEMATLVERARRRLAEAQENGGNRVGFSADALIA